MRRLHLDFVHIAPRRSWWGVALLALGGVAIAAVLIRFITLNSSAEALANEVADAQDSAHQERMAVRPGIGADSKLLARDVTQANLVLDSLNITWTALFKTLESVSVPNVTLLAVQPEGGASRRLRLAGEARRYEDALSYVGQLAATPGFSNAVLVSHEATVDARGRRAVQFAVTVDWVGQP